MSKTIIVVGFGPGISAAVAERFGAEGFSVALVARNEARLAAGVADLQAKGVTAAAFPADAGDASAIRAAVKQARARLGGITAIHWNAFAHGALGDLLEATDDDIAHVFDVAIFGLLAAVREALPDLKAAGDGAVLVTNGAFGETTETMDRFAVSLKAMGLSVANAAKHKLVGVLGQRLKDHGVHVAEVMVAGMVKQTSTGSGQGIESATIAEAFWKLYVDRGDVRARVT